MTKYKIVIGIILTVVTLSCIIASSFAWFTLSQNTVDGKGASLTAKDPSILTVSDDIFTIQDMGNYKGQTSFAFYRYIEEENNPAFEGKYILDKNGNKITKNFTAYNYNAQMKEQRTFAWNGTHENVGIYSISVTHSTVSGVSLNDRFYLRVNNSFDYVEPVDGFYLRNVDGNILSITDLDGNEVYNNSFSPIKINMFKTLTVSVGGTTSFTCSIGSLNQDYTTYSNTDNTTTVYDRLVSNNDSERYSLKGIDGAVTYDSKNNDTEITFDKESGITSVSKIVRTDEGTCKKIYEDADGNFTIEDKMFRIVKYITDAKTFYKIYDKALRPNCIYDGETDGVSISISETEITTYAVDDGKDMEDSAYRVGIQFEMILNTSGSTEYFLQFTPITVGIVPVRDSAKEMLISIDGTTTGDVYYTYIDSDKIMFGLDVKDDYRNERMKVTTVTNYEGDYKTVTNIQMDKMSSLAEAGKIRYETTRGYDSFYSIDGGNTFQYLTYDIDLDAVSKYVEIRGEKIAYDQEKHGDLRYAIKTTTGYNFYIRETLDYSSVLDEKGSLINNNYMDSLIFVFTEDSTQKCALYTEITNANRDRISEGLDNNQLFIARKNSVVYDAKGENIIYSKDKGNTIATTKRVMYFLPLKTFYENFTLEIDLIDRTSINDLTWDSMTAEAKNELTKTYKVDKEGNIVNEDGSIVGLKNTSGNSVMRLYSVARVYYADPYTFEHMHSDTELSYNYNYNLSTPMYTVESSGELTPFAYSDYSFMGSHFLIRLNVGSGEKGAGE